MLLLELGCDQAQGYLLGRSMPEEAFAALLPRSIYAKPVDFIPGVSKAFLVTWHLKTDCGGSSAGIDRRFVYSLLLLHLFNCILYLFHARDVFLDIPDSFCP